MKFLLRNARFAAVSALALGLLVGVSYAAGPYTQNTSGTTADGQLEALSDIVDALSGGISVGSVSTSGTANAAAPSYMEGSTTAPLSFNLSGDLRTISKQSGTWNIGTLTTLTGVTNPIHVIGDASSAVIGHVICDSGCSGSGGTSQNDNSAYTDGTTAFNAIGGEYNTSITNLTSGRVGAVQLTQDRQMYVNIGKVGGTSVGTPATSTSTSTPVLFVTPVDINGIRFDSTASTPVTTVDGGSVTLGAKADAKSTATDTTAITIMQVLKEISAMVQAPPSQAVTNAGTFAVQSSQSPSTTGGLSWYNVQPAASDNHVVIKAGAGQVYHIDAQNNSATVNYIRLYNATTGFNGCNSATNLVGQWIVPASTSGAGLVAEINQGVAFATGISICVTSGYANNDTTNATASAMVVNVGYK